MSDPAELYNAILTGNAKKAEEVTKAAIAANADPGELVQKYMIPAMDEVGQIGDPDRVHLLAGEKNVENGFHGRS